MADISDPEVPSGGFDCELLEKPKELQSNCPVCLMLLREPYIVNCCGKSFCRVCVEKVKFRNTSCPCCKRAGFDFFPNKGLQLPLYNYKVSCSKKRQGCQWRGNLGQLDSHINSNPLQEKELEGCQFVQVKCSYCLESFLRSDIEVHKNKDCLKRPYNCDYCRQFESTYGEVTAYHWPQCGHYPIPCPNRCGTTLQRQLLDNHIANDCPETMVDCDFKHFGCNVRLPRKNLPAHVNENLASHIGHMSQLIVRLEAENERLQEQLTGQQHRLAELRELVSLRTDTPTTALDLIMTKLESYKRNGNPWVSPSFYTQGYKLCLQVYVNDHGENDGICTTIFICSMQGQFDDQLIWPFHGEVVVQLLEDADDEGGCAVLHTHRIVHESHRVTAGGNLSFGRGITAVHSDLMRHVRNDCLHFRIPAVQSACVNH